MPGCPPQVSRFDRVPATSSSRRGTVTGMQELVSRPTKAM